MKSRKKRDQGAAKHVREMRLVIQRIDEEKRVISVGFEEAAHVEMGKEEGREAGGGESGYHCGDWHPL